jgi:hypothetical protein
MYKLEREIILNKHNEYENVITISPSPKKRCLKKITKKYTNNRKLSENAYQNTCLELLLDPTDNCEFLSPDNVENLIGYFAKKNITIDYQLTKLMQKSNYDLLFYIK